MMNNPATLNRGKNMLLSKILPTVANMHPTNYAIKSHNITLTYEQLLHHVNCVAYSFHQLGFKPGDRIALLGHPSPYLAIAECAAVVIGAIPVTLFPNLVPNEINQILQSANPIAIVYDSHHLQAEEYVPLLNSTYAIPLHACADTHSIETFIATSQSLSQWYEPNPDDIALIIYTGGTTSHSKGVMHSHRSISHWSFMDPKKEGGHNPTKKSIILNQAHITGQFMLWTTLYEGGCLIYAQSYPLRAEEVIDIIEREQIKNLGTVGLLLRDIVTMDGIQDRCLDSVEVISCGGAPISVDTLHKARKIFPNAQIKEVYSQTESGQCISFLSVNQCMIDGKLERLLSVGNPSDITSWGQQPFEIRIVDELGRDVQLGAVGEIICKGEQMMLGYWNNPVETKHAIRNGWLYTGDLGKFDEDGYLYLVDRKKDMVIVNGSNVYCSEVEEVLSRHPSIREIVIIGTPLPDEGEEVTAVITLNTKSWITLSELQQYFYRKLANYKVPTRLEIMDNLPRTTVGKMNKAAIRREYWMGRTRMIN
ncbi:class I adenylate-forming enzyme family protein [Paenibacillus arenosi]|uniref:Acyl--CoA ligase n=1 Tax=Paenibacillus arenosi TaxID=2774142 RepID=A0ABR9B293_9BACL|nr:class I adenylate-forming enzyme family protein [Paenibacillus arenosi]MBD8500492.1 acyl--CoA ligase [Paenibacillus arenosi]